MNNCGSCKYYDPYSDEYGECDFAVITFDEETIFNYVCVRSDDVMSKMLVKPDYGCNRYEPRRTQKRM